MFVPRTINEITPDWLTGVLRQHDGLELAEVWAIETQPVGDQGVNGELFRLNISYAYQGNAPGSLVAKLPVQQSLFERSQANWLNVRETTFYRQMGSRVGVQVPIIYAAASDEKRDAHVVLMQDLTDWTIGNDESGLTDQQLELAVDSLAGLHARWWNAPDLYGFDWVGDPEKELQVTAEQASAMWESGRDLVVELRGEELAKICDLWVGDFDFWRAKLAEPPFTLCHGDYRAGNLFFGDGTSDLVVIDWQRPNRCKAILDLAYLLSMALRGPDRKYKADDLIKRYHRSLQTKGVSGYSIDDLRNEFPLGLVFTAAALMLLSNGRPDPRAYLESSWISGALDMTEMFDTAAHLSRMKRG